MKRTRQKDSKDDDKAWMKWAYAGIALLIAVAMVGSYIAPVFNRGQAAQAGNIVVIGYTIRDEAGRPLITTDQNLMEREYQRGNIVLLSGGLEIPVGAQVSGENITVIPVLHPNIGEFSGFSLLGFERNTISERLVGMRPGETKTVSFSYGENKLEENLNKEDADGLGLNMTEWSVGDLVPLGLTSSPDIPIGNETAPTPALRFGKVTAKSPDSMAITYRYGSAEVMLYNIIG
jgi:hypothetical protein